jgi:hypothetical protein
LVAAARCDGIVVAGSEMDVPALPASADPDRRFDGRRLVVPLCPAPSFPLPGDESAGSRCDGGDDTCSPLLVVLVADPGVLDEGVVAALNCDT